MGSGELRCKDSAAFFPVQLQCLIMCLYTSLKANILDSMVVVIIFSQAGSGCMVWVPGMGVGRGC